MSHTEDRGTVVRTWTNGSKADVDLVSLPDRRIIRKRYRAGVVPRTAMFREYLGLKMLQGLEFVPSVVEFLPFERQLAMSFLEGQRVLEWVLERFGAPGIDLEFFASFHGLNEREDIKEAFARFRSSTAPEAQRLRQDIARSYTALHRRRVIHGDPSPRNLLYDGKLVYLIDFDHWRPSAAPAKIDGRAIQNWYGIGV